MADPKNDLKNHSKNDDIENEDVLEVRTGEPVVVRETRRLYRLTAGRQCAVVAADSEEEARAIAASHDALGGDWSSAEFASSAFEETAELHVFGDVLFTSIAPPRSKQRSRGRP